ncbi:FkbM family methyltransferase [Mucilaginibacter lappiensis]|uniref:FkbM family methyltransferase n=1 Tax=Mucilaginibacter lappiensis TaxID=354630 RepID=A0A1N6R966_9SPHI|nr:FkbM family methyltransferase [Mucilaginibacter lappiensis]MBB6108754.1 FkbM family methyltransferase [Mucilaginibacter lappiensis]MBB6129367.1 FkbM family methyltransferase [Mucilaginibacter lappiensis]SIQ25379.1 methyltransferase, FkbM family [Mucilaginibacter lappiensis]
MAINDALLIFFIKNKLRGKDRLFTLLAKLGFRRFILLNVKYDIQLQLNPNEYIDNLIIKEGFYESEITEEIFKHLQSDGIFWDIGANIGIHSIAVKKNFPNCKVYSFEPNPSTLSLLYDNIKLNHLDIQICGFALFDKIGSMTLHITDGNSGMTTLTPWHEIKFNQATKCLTTTGDTLVSESFDAPTVIKLDTEGSELHVLKGCKEILKNPALKAIIFEAGSDLLENLDNDETALLLNEFAFKKIKRLTRNENTHHGLSNFVALKD